MVQVYADLIRRDLQDFNFDLDADFAGCADGRRFSFIGAVYQNRLAVKIAGFLLCEHKRSLQLRLSSGRAAGVKPSKLRLVLFLVRAPLQFSIFY